MSFRAPSMFSGGGAQGFVIDQVALEIHQEKAASLGAAGEKAEKTLAAWRAAPVTAENRLALRREAIEAVHAYFIQRELCGFGDHALIIREMDIPAEILLRLGAREQQVS